jgi:hypothetical protein
MLPGFLDSGHVKVARLSAELTGRVYLQRSLLVLISVKRLSRTQGHSAAGRIKSIKNLKDPSFFPSVFPCSVFVLSPYLSVCLHCPGLFLYL